MPQDITKRDGAEVVIIPFSVQRELAGKCFRQRKRLAGNFNRWLSADQVINDPKIFLPLVQQIREIHEDGPYGMNNATIDYGMPVGWSSTAPRGTFRSNQLEEFEINKRATGLRVKLLAREVMAPVTNLVTFTLDYRPEGADHVATVLSIQPGTSVGELVGNVTERNDVVFFAWNHVGA